MDASVSRPESQGLSPAYHIPFLAVKSMWRAYGAGKRANHTASYPEASPTREEKDIQITYYSTSLSS